jgi:hypothetical protein
MSGEYTTLRLKSKLFLMNIMNILPLLKLPFIGDSHPHRVVTVTPVGPGKLVNQCIGTIATAFLRSPQSVSQAEKHLESVTYITTEGDCHPTLGVTVT